MKISVIIPTLNEAAHIRTTVEGLRDVGFQEILVADGGSEDGTPGIALRAGARVIPSPRGRALQMNAGAAAASGDLFLFLHADTRLPEGGAGAIRRVLEDDGVAGGAFSLGIDSSRPALRGIAWMATLRTRLTRIPFGDQGIFVRREVFDRMRGFPPFPLMEDVAFSRRMKKIGRVVILREKALTSSRRWEREGVLYGTLRNWGLLVLFFLGVSPFRLKQWYGDAR